MLLASYNACNVRMRLCQYFFTYWKASNIPNLKKQNQQSDRYEQLRWKKINEVQVWMCYNIARAFTKNNLSRDCLPSTLDVLVLHLPRALIFFHYYLFNFFFFLNTSASFIKIYKIQYQKKSLCIKYLFRWNHFSLMT